MPARVDGGGALRAGPRLRAAGGSRRGPRPRRRELPSGVPLPLDLAGSRDLLAPGEQRQRDPAPGGGGGAGCPAALLPRRAKGGADALQGGPVQLLRRRGGQGDPGLRARPRCRQHPHAEATGDWRHPQPPGRPAPAAQVAGLSGEVPRARLGLPLAGRRLRGERRAERQRGAGLGALGGDCGGIRLVAPACGCGPRRDALHIGRRAPGHGRACRSLPVLPASGGHP
mmetsp:Transcript_35944/g.103381  ORF Transcript_35944/g.103381 Transcript_35944/m.103381 type:complete len:227 (+) Transcript_35944:619-1299(+)